MSTSLSSPMLSSRAPGEIHPGTSSSSMPLSSSSAAAAALATFRLPTREERNRAAMEAEECLEAVNREGFQLDGFNLLGVVANPRSGGSGSTATTTTTATTATATTSSQSAPMAETQQPQQLQLQQQQQQQQPSSNVPTARTPQYGSVSSGDPQQQHQQQGLFSDAVQTFEYTLAQVAEQIESLNVYLEELSRHYLGDDADESLFLEYYYRNEEEDANSPEHMMRADNIPKELVNLELHDLQAYLEECGVLAHTLVAQALDTRTLNEEDVIDEEKLRRQLEDIPAVFYDEGFDLTDARTFAELLLRQDGDELDGDVGIDERENENENEHDNPGKNGSRDATKTATTKTTSNHRKTKAAKAASTPGARNSLYQPTHELVPVREQDFLAGHLDKVELALQEQVRQKSTAFFHETTRFRQLQSSIVDLLQQVQTLRVCLRQALGVYQQTRDVSDHQRRDYEILVDLLDGAVELVRCKASIGGLLSANDHLGAALQIQYGRRLLNGSGGDGDGSGSSGEQQEKQSETESGSDAVATNGNKNASAESSSSNHTATTLELRLLTALSSCGDQFAQYESLVVQNLSEELVEVFFHWRPSERERVRETIEALRICNALRRTSELYQRRLQQMIRMTVRTTIAEFIESSSAATSSSSPTASKSASNSKSSPTKHSKSSGGVTGMTYPAFYNCLQLLIEEIQSILTMAHRVDEFCASEEVLGEQSSQPSQQSQQSQQQQQQQQLPQRWTREAVAQGAELATKSIAELLRLRKEAHSVVSLAEMKQLWDTCIEFAAKMEGYCDRATRAVGLRSTLAGQARAFLDRTHESNMSALVAALDSERWSQCEVSNERQAALTRLCTGLATVSTPLRNIQQNGGDDSQGKEKKPVAVVEGVNYKVVWSCLLLVEMIMTNLSSAAYFQQILATNAVTKVVELMRLFNARTTTLVLGAGAIHSAARLKSINAKHLSYVTQCLGMTISLLPHIRAALMAQLPPKQHALLTDLDSIKNEYKDHNEKVLNKFVSIIGGIVEHGLAPRIAGTNFDQRGQNQQPTPNDRETIECFVFLDGISTSTRKLHTVLNALLPPDHLQDVFSRIFAHLDQQMPALFVAAASTGTFSFPSTDIGKHRLLSEVAQTTKTLNGLKGVLPWDFTAIHVLERKLEYKLPEPTQPSEDSTEEEGASAEDESEETGATDAKEIQAQNVDGSETPTEAADPQVNGDSAPNAASEEGNTESAKEDDPPPEADAAEESGKETGATDAKEIQAQNVDGNDTPTEAADPQVNGDSAPNAASEEGNTESAKEDDPPPEADAAEESGTVSNGELPTSNGSENIESAAAEAKTDELVNGEGRQTQENGSEPMDNGVPDAKE